MVGDSASRQRASSSAAGRRRCSLFFLALLVFQPGCGDEGGTPPVLTGYQVPWPPRFLVGFPQATIIGKVSFEDPDGDVVLLRVTWRDCGQDPVKRFEIVQEDLKRTKIGQMPFTVMISTDCPIGNYTVSLSATDGRGYDSNVLVVPYEIYASLE